jgi:hypothetical protein
VAAGETPKIFFQKSCANEGKISILQRRALGYYLSNDKAGTINEAENSSSEAISCVLLSCFVVRVRGRKEPARCGQKPKQ